MKLRSAHLLILILMLTAWGRSATLEDYAGRLSAAAGQLHQLGLVKDVRNAQREEQVLDRVLREVPVTEKIEWTGGSVETDNAWLLIEVNTFRTESDGAKRGAILNGVEGRLLAQRRAVADLQEGLASASTKDADKQKLAEILRRPEYQPPATQEESLFQKWWKAFLKWIDDMFPSAELIPSESLGLGSLRLVLQIVIFAVVAVLIGFLLWRFLPFFSARFGKKAKGGRGDRVILGEIVGPEESASDIFSEAERLAREGDIRGAIRKGYIAVLCELGDRRMVRLTRSKTNRDYLRDVRRSPQVFKGLSGLTENFERNWYGLRVSAPEDWEAFRDGYDKTLRGARGNA